MSKELITAGPVDTKAKAPLIKDHPKVVSNGRNNVPPAGLSAFQMFKDGGYWSVWAFRVKEGGDIEVEKVLEREVYDIARFRTGKLTVEAQIEMCK